VKGVVGAFAKDQRVLAWDIWNEPDNENHGSYNQLEPKNKVELVLALLPQVFAWARAAGAEQPLTSGIWKGDWSTPEKMTPMDRLQIELSDVVTFHNYDAPTELEKRINWLKRYNRPLICTEYMARGNGSFFFGSLPVAKVHNVGMINWGFAFRARRKRICRGIRGSVRMSIASRRFGFTRSFGMMDGPTSWKKWSSFDACPAKRRQKQATDERGLSVSHDKAIK
jgi:hypothetical protein